MLGKLLKYEFKAQGAMYLGIYLIALLFSVIAVASDKINQALNGNPVFSTMRVFSLAAAVIALIAIFIITVVMCIIRYRNNLLKDEGYLMHTLPVSAASLHFSKLLAGIIWFIGDIAVLMISVGILTEDFRYTWIKSFKAILEQSGLKIDAGMAFVFVLYIVLSVISSLSMFYACLNLGSLSYSSKGIMAFVWYIILYMVGQIVSVIGLVILCIVQYGSNFAVLFQTQTDTAPTGFVMGTFVTSVIIAVILTAAYNFASLYILDKKLNLE
jgi:hypothetical protein